MILRRPLPNPFCTCKGDKKDSCSIYPKTDRSNHVEHYKYDEAADGPCVKRVFPRQRKKTRVILLKKFAPDPRFPDGSTIMTSMMNPPTWSKFLKLLGKRGLTIETTWTLGNTDVATMDVGSLSDKEVVAVKATLKSCSDQTKDVKLLVNEVLEITGTNINTVVRQLAKMIQNDVIEMVRHETKCHAVFNFAFKDFEIFQDGALEEVIPLDLFRKARDIVRQKEGFTMYNRQIVFAD